MRLVSPSWNMICEVFGGLYKIKDSRDLDRESGITQYPSKYNTKNLIVLIQQGYFQSEN